MSRIVNKEVKWRHKKDCCNDDSGVEVLTPYPKKRNWFERKLDRYNHIMELVRTLLGIATVTLQLIILYRLWN